MAHIQSPYSVYEIWKRRETSQEPLLEEDWGKPQWLLVYKHQQQVFVKHLSEPAYLILNHLCSGMRIEDALEHTLQDYPALTASTVSEVFALITLTGIVTHLEKETPPSQHDTDDNPQPSA